MRYIEPWRPKPPPPIEAVLEAGPDSAEPWGPSGGALEPIVAFSEKVLGLPLYPAQAELLSESIRDPIRTAIWQLGRRSGKDRMASVLAAYEATVGADRHRANLPPGEEIAIVIVANSQAQSRTTHKLIGSYFRRKELARYRARETADAILLANGVAIRTLPCSARTVRGMAAAVVIFNEAAWYLDTDGSPMSGEELWDALVPSTAQFDHGRVLVASTPRWSVGWFPDLVRQATSGEHPDMGYWWAPTATMNPTIRAEFLESERAKDPSAFLREYEARFGSGHGAVFEEVAVRDAVKEYAELRPEGANYYTIAVDAGYVADTFAVVVGHRQENRVVVDKVTGWSGRPGAPVDHRSALDNVAAIAKAYGDARVLLDQFAAEPVAQGLAERGVGAVRKPWRNELKQDAVTVLRQLFYQSRIDLPRHPNLVSELVQLEQHPLPSGRLRFEAPPGAHDDYATALLALAHDLEQGTGQVVVGPDLDELIFMGGTPKEDRW